MKKITKPSEPEEAVYYSDFTGKLLPESTTFGAPITVQIDFNYGSKYDGSKIELHLDDNDFYRMKAFLTYETTREFLDYLKKELKD
jgi:hypothetical protein